MLLSSLATPITAFGQVPGTEAVLMQSPQAIPEAKTWYVDDDGNFVLITQQQLVELAQAPATGIPLQALSGATSEAVTIPAGMFNQIIMYSAGIGGLAGGALVGGLMLATSGDAGSGITVSSGSSGNSNSGGVKNATISVVDDAIARGETGGEITYTLNDIDGIDESDLIASLADAVANNSTLGAVFPTGATVSTLDQSGLIPGSSDAYSTISFTYTGDIGETLNVGTYTGPEISFSDNSGNIETVNLQLTISDPGLTFSVDGGVIGSTFSGSSYADRITINTMPAQGTVNALGGSDTIILNDVLATGETVDAGNGDDLLILYTNLTAGDVVDIETVDIRTTALVDLDRFSGPSELQVNVQTSNVVTIDQLRSETVNTTSYATLVILEMANSANTATFAAGGNLTLESQDAFLTDIVVDMDPLSALTLTADGTNDAITALHMNSVGSLYLEGPHIANLMAIDASGVDGNLTCTATDFGALASYEGAGGIDTIDVSGVTGTATINLNAGTDVFVSSAVSGTLVIDGGAGTDNFTLAASGAAIDIINVTDLSDLKVTAIANAAALTAAITANAFEVVTNFTSGTDEFNMDNMGLSNISTVQTDMASAYVQLTTNDVVILAENGVNYDGDTSTDDYFIIVDTAGDHSAVGIIKIDSATIVQSDIDIF